MAKIPKENNQVDQGSVLMQCNYRDVKTVSNYANKPNIVATVALSGKSANPAHSTNRYCDSTNRRVTELVYLIDH